MKKKEKWQVENTLKSKEIVPSAGSKMAKYRTTIWQHIKKAEGCAMGDRCFFAHSIHEIRNESDPIPLEIK